MLFWKENVRRQRVTPGARAGSLNGHGYRNIKINCILYIEHRLVFLMHHGFLPPELDHINGIKSDNHIENLRAINRSGNLRNRKSIWRNNTSGVTGVSWHTKRKVWSVQLKGAPNIHIGYFKNFADAVKGRIDAEQKYFPDFYPNRDYDVESLEAMHQKKQQGSQNAKG